MRAGKNLIVYVFVTGALVLFLGRSQPDPRSSRDNHGVHETTTDRAAPPQMQSAASVVVERDDADASGIPETATAGSPKLYAFYNVFVSESRGPYRDIVQDQMNVLNASGTLALLERLFYNVVGPDGANFFVPGGPKAERMRYIPEGQEIDTLGDLWDFCRANPDARALYLHNKGSANLYGVNEKFRRALDCTVLTPRCIYLLDSYDLCSIRLSVVPYLHVSGNFFWTTCKHVARLVDPRIFRNASFKLAHDQEMKAHRIELCEDWATGVERYWAEAWVTSLPDFKVADCLNASVADNYVFGFPTDAMLRNMRPTCPSVLPGWAQQMETHRELLWGMRCGNASLISEPRAYGGYGFRRPQQFGICDSLTVINAKTRILYGADHSLAIRARALYGEAWPPRRPLSAAKELESFGLKKGALEVLRRSG